jgi:uncharacterized protein YutE (UPF0331/DUF86 family)
MIEKQFNVWSVQEQLSELSSQKQLDMNLKAHRDQYIKQLMIEKTMDIFNNTAAYDDLKKKKVKNDHRKCNIL